jgi:DNA-binding transcriptional ArsR family regulator
MLRQGSNRSVRHRAYDRTMSISEDVSNSGIVDVAGAIGDPARASMLCCLMDGRARTSTELAVIAGVSASTASSHLGKLRKADLVRVHVRGKHHYYSLKDPRVAEMLEGMMALSQNHPKPFAATTPQHLRAARSCYDHIAGTLGVAVHDKLLDDGWLAHIKGHDAYDVTDKGEAQLAKLGVDVGAVRRARRRFACPCMDWSERRPHLGGAVGAALLTSALERGWLLRELDSRSLRVTRTGQKIFGVQVGVHLPFLEVAHS